MSRLPLQPIQGFLAAARARVIAAVIVSPSWRRRTTSWTDSTSRSV
jgi:hypothetical protein